MTAPVFTHIRLTVDLGTVSGATFSAVANPQVGHTLYANPNANALSEHKAREIVTLVDKLVQLGAAGASSTDPAITTITAKSCVVNVGSTPVDVGAITTDADGGAIAYSATGLPTGLSIHATTGVISGTPTVVGVYPVRVIATDADGIRSGFTVFVYTITAS